MKKKFIAILSTCLLIISSNALIAHATVNNDNNSDTEVMIEDPNGEFIIESNSTNQISRVFVGKTIGAITATSISPGNILTTRNKLSVNPSDTPTNKVGVEYSSNVKNQKVGICYYNSVKNAFVSEGDATTSTTSGAVSFSVKYVSSYNHYCFVKNTSSSTITNGSYSFIGM